MLALSKKLVLSFVLGFILLASIVNANASSPVFVGKMRLVFENEISCELTDFNDSKSTVKGRTNIVHDDKNISWTSNCVIQLPQNVKYCSMVEQEVTNPDAFSYWYSGFQTKVLRAKIISESDVNPAFGIYSAVYYCFD